MCGLVGIAGDLGLEDELFMKRLLILDYFRGTDSTGLASVSFNGSIEVAKAAVNPLTLFDMKTFETALNGHKSTAFIGHNRAATLGKVNDANAHPYQFGDVVGAHNGTLDKNSWERLEFEAGIKTNTDSAAIFASINEVGINDTIPMMEHGRYANAGAWALTYFNRSHMSMNFIKNEHRPLWYAFNQKRDKIYWASEWAFLDAAAKMTRSADRPDWWYDEDGFCFFPFVNDQLYSVALATLRGGLSDEEYEEFVNGQTIEGREPAPLAVVEPKATNGGGGTPWEKANTTGSTTTQSSGSSNGLEGLDDDIQDFINGRNFQVQTLERSDSNPLCGLVSEERFNQIAKYGCSFCGADIDINDNGYTVYDEDDCILCSDCSKHDNGNVKLYLGNGITVN